MKTFLSGLCDMEDVYLFLNKCEWAEIKPTTVEKLGNSTNCIIDFQSKYSNCCPHALQYQNAYIFNTNRIGDIIDFGNKKPKPIRL